MLTIPEQHQCGGANGRTAVEGGSCWQKSANFDAELSRLLTHCWQISKRALRLTIFDEQGIIQSYSSNEDASVSGGLTLHMGYVEDEQSFPLVWLR
jgi:hypothetical protein